MSIKKETQFEITHDYEAVLIIGNGFDLNLGLNTSYTDFIKSHEFQSLILNNNLLSIHLANKHNLQNWIDIENELKIYSKSFSSQNQNLQTEFKSLTKALGEYLKKIDYKSINKENTAYKLIEKLSKHTTLIIDFNYTSTLEIILNEIKKGKTYSRIDHVKIHGNIKNDNLIFGVEDKADIYPKHIFFKKSVNINFKPLDFSKVIIQANSFSVFGHSLGETDHMYFEEFFRHTCRDINKTNPKSIYIYYYGEGNYYNIYKQIDTLTFKKITKFKQYNDVKFYDLKKE